MRNFDEICYIGARVKDGAVEVMQTQNNEYVSLQLSWADGRKTADGKKSYTNINAVSFLKSVVDRFKPDENGFKFEVGDRVRVQGELQSNNRTTEDGKTIYGYQVNISEIRMIEKRAGQIQQGNQGNQGNLPNPTGYVTQGQGQGQQAQAQQGMPSMPMNQQNQQAGVMPTMVSAQGQQAQAQQNMYGMPMNQQAGVMPTMVSAQGQQGMPSMPMNQQAGVMPTMVPAQGQQAQAQQREFIMPSMAPTPAQNQQAQGDFTLPTGAPLVTPNIPTIQGVGGMPLANMAS